MFLQLGSALSFLHFYQLSLCAVPFFPISVTGADTISHPNALEKVSVSASMWFWVNNNNTNTKKQWSSLASSLLHPDYMAAISQPSEAILKPTPGMVGLQQHSGTWGWGRGEGGYPWKSKRAKGSVCYVETDLNKAWQTDCMNLSFLPLNKMC